MNPLKKLHAEQDQAVWLDFVARGFVLLFGVQFLERVHAWVSAWLSQMWPAGGFCPEGGGEIRAGETVIRRAPGRE
jgi:hypothetical protein